MKSPAIPLSILFLASVLLIGASTVDQSTTDRDDPQTESNTMQVQYLEIVTKSVNETCEVLSKSHDVEFSKPIPELGNARTALLKDGGRIGVRAPMRDTETPVVRPYILVDDIEAAVKAAEEGGAQIAIPPMNIPGQGTFSIYILGGIEHGLWQK